MIKYKFTKIAGAGNDFILFDKKVNPDLELDAAAIKKLCARHTGIGADGLLIISDEDSYNFGAQYFEADGSTGNLCANGARCVVKYALINNYVSGKVVGFLFNGRGYSGEILENGFIKINLDPPEDIKLNFEIEAANQLLNVSYINTGSPHIVIKIDEILRDPNNINSGYVDIHQFPVYNLGKEIRHLNEFGVNGTNVNFIKIVGNKIFIRSFERGVENETLSCGTGSVAAAVISHLNENLKSPIDLVTKSGDILTVDFSVENLQVKELSLTGPVKVVFHGEIII